MALRMWASSTANALRLSSASKSHLSPAFSLSRCFSSVLEGLKYATSHEWVKVEGPVATIGITDHAQDHLGEVVFVEVPDAGGSVTQGSSFGAVESVKATSDVNSPISGQVVEVNTKLSESPGLVMNKKALRPRHDADVFLGVLPTCFGLAFCAILKIMLLSLYFIVLVYVGLRSLLVKMYFVSHFPIVSKL